METWKLFLVLFIQFSGDFNWELFENFKNIEPMKRFSPDEKKLFCHIKKELFLVCKIEEGNWRPVSYFNSRMLKKMVFNIVNISKFRQYTEMEILIVAQA